MLQNRPPDTHQSFIDYHLLRILHKLLRGSSQKLLNKSVFLTLDFKRISVQNPLQVF